MIPPEIRHTIQIQTEGVWLMDRVKTAKHIIRKYMITDNADIKEVAKIANVPEEKLSEMFKTVTMQQRLT
jgi:hypothetical protein